MDTPSELDYAWMAGFVDGDGAIVLNRTGHGGNWGKPLLVVDNTDIEMLDECTRIAGGGSLVRKRKTAGHHRQAYSWRRYGANQVRELLVHLLPHMRCDVKRERARMLIEEYPALTPRNGHYTDEMRAAKLEWEDRFMSLGNGRGWRSHN